MQRRTLAVAVLPVVAFIVTACASDGSTAPATLSLTATDSAQVAALSVSDATAEDVDLMYASEGSLGGGASFAVAPGTTLRLDNAPGSTASGDSVRFAFWAFGHNCPYDAGSGRFTCTDTTKGGLSLMRSFALFDQGGSPMDAYNDTLTASANFQVAVTGIHTAPRGADTVSRQRDLTVTGLLGHETQRTWNGQGTRNDAGYRTDSAKTRAYSVHDTATIANVVVEVPRLVHPWPLSGTITRQVHGMATVSRPGVTKSFTIDRTATITFNGTRYVPLVVGSHEFTLDLLTGRVSQLGT